MSPAAAAEQPKFDAKRKLCDFSQLTVRARHADLGRYGKSAPAPPAQRQQREKILGKTSKHLYSLATGLALVGLAPYPATAGTDSAWVCHADATGAWDCQRKGGGSAPAAGTPAAATTPGTSPAVTPKPPAAALPSTPSTAAAPRASAPATAMPSAAPAATGAGAEPTARRPTACGPAPTTPFVPGPADGLTRINADQSSGTQQHFVLSGNVEVARDNQRLRADHVIYDQASDRATAEGHVRLRQPGLQITGPSGHVQVHGDSGAFDQAHYELPRYNARGDAARIEKLDSDRTRLQQAIYTTCPAQNPAWILSASKVDLYQREGIGTARNVTVRFQHVPLFYTPYLSFPIDNRRKSGFLAPSAGSSGNSGAELSIPYYWNIAPNQDATITPRILAKRGLQLNGEYRYLTSNTRGILGAEYLPNDRVYGKDRWLVGYQQQGSYGPHWSTNVSLNSASDANYFRDLGQTLSLASTTSLERRADLSYNNGPWSVLGRVQNFQALGTTSGTYARLPQLVVNADLPDPNRPLTYHIYGEAVRFGQNGSAVTGDRLDLYPGVSMNLHGPAWYVTPKASVRFTQYALDNPAPGQAASPDRTTPILSLDSGLYFERDTAFGGHPLVQTLEPRLYYLYVPYTNQSAFPVFDTTALDFRFAQLFRENRFTGADRQGDANQVAAAVTTRFLDSRSGQERLRASLGEIFYFRDRRVILPGESVDRSSRSALVSEVAAAVSQRSSVSTAWQWDPSSRQTDKAVLRYHYQVDQRRILNLEYRYLRGYVKQVDASALWPLSRSWNALARWNYSVSDNKTLEAFAGVEYNNCCWAVRVVGRRYVNGFGGAENTAIYLQLVLKGLTSVGTHVEQLLERGILGYGNDLYVQ